MSLLLLYAGSSGGGGTIAAGALSASGHSTCNFTGVGIATGALSASGLGTFAAGGASFSGSSGALTAAGLGAFAAVGKVVAAGALNANGIGLAFWVGPAAPVTAPSIEPGDAGPGTLVGTADPPLAEPNALLISLTDVQALALANPAECGIVIGDSETFAQAMDRVATSVGACYGFDPAGLMRMARLEPPSGEAVLSIGVDDADPATERRSPGDGNIPVWSVSVNYARAYETQPTDVAGAVTAARRAFLASEFRTATVTDDAVRTQHVLAKTLSVDTCLCFEADALTEAGRLLALYGVRRDIFDVPAPVGLLDGQNLKATDPVSLTLTRFGLAGGRTLRLIGIRYELAKSQAIISLWG
jgi:hypothetical protein